MPLNTKNADNLSAICVPILCDGAVFVGSFASITPFFRICQSNDSLQKTILAVQEIASNTSNLYSP